MGQEWLEDRCRRHVLESRLIGRGVNEAAMRGSGNVGRTRSSNGREASSGEAQLSVNEEDGPPEEATRSGGELRPQLAFAGTGCAAQFCQASRHQAAPKMSVQRRQAGREQLLGRMQQVQGATAAGKGGGRG